MDLVYSPKGFIEITNIGDTVNINFQGTEKQGVVTAVTSRGVNIRNNEGVIFYKWEHIRKLIKKQFTII